MPLTTYELARPWARAIREEILERRMPPWGAVEGFGHFSNDVSLTQREMDIILSWADGGAPSGVLKVEENIPPVFVPAAPMWEAGEPDAVLTADKRRAFLPGSGDQTRRFDVTARIRHTACHPHDRVQTWRPPGRPLRRHLRDCVEAVVVDMDTWQTFMTPTGRRGVSSARPRAAHDRSRLPRD